MGLWKRKTSPETKPEVPVIKPETPHGLNPQANPGRDPSIGRPFALATDLYQFDMSPSNGWQVMTSVGDPKVTMFRPAPVRGHLVFDVRTIPENTWVGLQDGESLVPMELHRNRTQVLGRWVEVIGGPLQDPVSDASDYTDADRQEDKYLLNNLRDLKHGTAMGQIGKITYF